MKVIWAPPARRRFLDMIEHIWRQHPQGARRCADAVNSAAEELANLPYRYRDRGNGIRIMPVLGTPFMLHYRVERDIVRILLVRHGHQVED
jgi:plasmid stabilization system protein ParE